MDRDSELTIVAGLQQGDRRAWGRLYDAYAERLWTGVCRLMGFDCVDVADVVQETFLAAARSARGYNRDRGSLWAWLWGIARRQVALHYRKQGAKATLVGAESLRSALDHRLDWIEGKSDPPPEILQTREMAALVRYALSELPGDYQMLLLAKHVDGRSVNVMARELNCSHAAAASRLARARKAFRRVFRKLTKTVRSTPGATEVSS